jgi:mutator protein MutT
VSRRRVGSHPQGSPASSAEAPSVPVVAAVVCREGRYLLARRPEDKRHGGLWEFPGGKILGGESHLDAVRRELAEELGLEVTSLGALLQSVTDPGSRFQIDFVEVHARGEAEAREHTEVAWLSREELSSVSLAPADARFVAWLTGAR